MKKLTPAAMAARKGSSEKRLKKLSANASDDELREFYDACKKAEVEPSDTLRKLAQALARHVREHGYVSFPLRLASPPRSSRPES